MSIQWCDPLTQPYQQILADFSDARRLTTCAISGRQFCFKSANISDILRISVAENHLQVDEQSWNWFRKCLMTTSYMTHDFHLRDSAKILFSALAVLNFFMNVLLGWSSYVRNILFTTVFSHRQKKNDHDHEHETEAENVSLTWVSRGL